ncbi:neural-cadherin-like, partial [Schistocerca serialis cubense]|uniref:neural-cadherin-like n=1 Tax=Schistocerca serialis cubense TaxID=2023355 RepID=UPI00214E31F0
APSLAASSPPRRRSVAVLADDTYPGYGVKQFAAQPGASYRLLDTGFSQFFAVVSGGLLMTTADLHPLVGRPVSLAVLEDAGNRSSTHSLQLLVLDRRDMLRFREAAAPARVRENAPPGSGVAHLALAGGAGGRVRYAIVAGDPGGDFRLAAANATGVAVETARPLDREKTPAYNLTVEAADGRGADRAVTTLPVEVLDENDNSPVFSSKVYRFSVAVGGRASDRFRTVGKVAATDADGDRVAYRLAAPSGLVVVVPQTGELLLAEEPPEEDVEYEIAVEAHDLRSPSRTSQAPAQVWLQFNGPADDDGANEVASEEWSERSRARVHRIAKRRVTRAVRPTKRIEFTEADGGTEGRAVFTLEKETERETFKIRDENPWVTVEPNGAVRVKKKWDYEELGPEKTIDFWVTITNAGGGGGTCGLLCWTVFAGRCHCCASPHLTDASPAAVCSLLETCYLSGHTVYGTSGLQTSAQSPSVVCSNHFRCS